MLDGITKRDMCPILQMEENFDSLGKAAVFRALHKASPYWNVEMCKEDHKMAALTLLHGFINMYKFYVHFETPGTLMKWPWP